MDNIDYFLDGEDDPDLEGMKKVAFASTDPATGESQMVLILGFEENAEATIDQIIGFFGDKLDGVDIVAFEDMVDDLKIALREELKEE